MHLNADVFAHLFRLCQCDWRRCLPHTWHSLCTKHSPRPVAIHQLVSSSRHPSSTFTACLPPHPPSTLSHTGREGTQEVPSGWHIASALGRLQRYGVWRMRPLTPSVLFSFSSIHSFVFVQIRTGIVRKQGNMLTPANGPIWGLSGALNLGRLWIHYIIHFPCYLNFSVWRRRIGCLEVQLICYWLSEGE